jgi:hypothetical protein
MPREQASPQQIASQVYAPTAAYQSAKREATGKSSEFSKFQTRVQKDIEEKADKFLFGQDIGSIILGIGVPLILGSLTGGTGLAAWWKAANVFTKAAVAGAATYAGGKVGSAISAKPLSAETKPYYKEERKEFKAESERGLIKSSLMAALYQGIKAKYPASAGGVPTVEVGEGIVDVGKSRLAEWERFVSQAGKGAGGGGGFGDIFPVEGGGIDIKAFDIIGKTLNTTSSSIRFP